MPDGLSVCHCIMNHIIAHHGAVWLTPRIFTRLHARAHRLLPVVTQLLNVSLQGSTV